TFIRLTDYNNAEEKTKQFYNRELYYERTQDGFADISGSPIAYWASEQVRKVFKGNNLISESVISPSQNVTGNNSKYLRFFWEINYKNHYFFDGKWRFYAKGGGFRKWYGNLLELVDWSPKAREAYRVGHASQIIPEDYWFKEGITWGLITSQKASFRVLPKHSTFDKGGSSIFPHNNTFNKYILSFL